MYLAVTAFVCAHVTELHVSCVTESRHTVLCITLVVMVSSNSASEGAHHARVNAVTQGHPQLCNSSSSVIQLYGL